MTARNINRQEAGVIKKRWRGKRSVAIVFPDSYGLAMANLGFQRVYELLNCNEDIVAERFFYNGISYDFRSAESNRHVLEFDIIIFSISFELSYLNVAPFLMQAGIPPLRKDRAPYDSPLILAGGVACQINPSPVADFVDAFLLGDFEAIYEDLVSFLINRDINSSRKDRLLTELAESLAGVYCPGIHSRGKGIVTPAFSKKGLSTVAHTVVVSDRSSFPNTFLLEITRGCGRGCRFCAAGFVYRPPRNWSEEAINYTLSDTKGARKVGLVGLEYASSSIISGLCEGLIKKGFQLGFSSLRADALTEEFVRLLVRSKNYTAAIAPEAGSERLRRIINKNLTEEQIVSAAEILARVGLRNLKLYFMIGLPMEEDDDVEEIAILSKKVRDIMLAFARGRGRAGKIIVSVATFVPKAWTPFQWVAFVESNVLKRRRKILREMLGSVPNIRLRLDSIEGSIMQALLSRGDERLGKILGSFVLRGLGNKRIVKEISNIAENYLKERRLEEELPWEVINHRVKRNFLLAQWKRAQRAQETAFCNLQVCRRCGACG